MESPKEVPSSLGKRPAVRHVEARRTSTCRFGDRVAQISVQHYKQHVPASFLESQQTCVATVVAHEHAEDRLIVLAMGVGTKFLTEATLRKETCDGEMYGVRVRDLHAEVLARRAFRRYLTEVIRRCRDGSEDPSGFVTIEPAPAQKGPSTKFRLKDGITLHFYCSSSPCGNSVIKKFGTMKKEVFRDDLPQQCWPIELHDSMPGHSIHLGQFALLLKKDKSTCVNAGAEPDKEILDTKPNPQWRRELSSKQEKWPIHCNSDWCPPGSTPSWSTEGSLHTCSDKLARWNYLGLQGSLLSSLLSSPLYIESITAGRKFSAMTCRRAVCCRIGRRFENDASNGLFRLQHPAIMGTSVYLDESGVIDMSEDRPTGQDVRFHSSLCYVSWLQESSHVMECLDGNTGFAIAKDGASSGVHNYTIEDLGNIRFSAISTATLVKGFLEIHKTTEQSTKEIETMLRSPLTLHGIRELKASFAAPYEDAKNCLLQTHPVMRTWNRR